MTILDLARAAERADHVAPFNEASLMALTDGSAMRLREYDEVVAAVAVGDAPVEFVVHPRYRRQGRGAALLKVLRDAGEQRFWAHGDLPAARALAASAELVAVRTLLVLRAEFESAPGPGNPPDGVTIRTYTETDADQLVDVNARAFASHPEQGAMDRADFDRRRAEPWFDPAGLFVAERDGRVVGFHWTKAEPGESVGEVYVVGVAPDAAGSGLGTALTSRGLRHLYDTGHPMIDLYVEGDNTAALAVYTKLGFTEHARDVLYEDLGS